MSALLLRLFESEHFTLQLAVSYLRNYADSIGVTSYLVRRLGEYSDADLEFYWPQLCHLLITRPSESVALENLILSRCETSIHLSMLTLWNLQASLSDLQKTPNSPAFAICRRALNRVQSNIFSDHLPSPNGLTTAQTLGISEVPKVLAHPQPAVVGLGMLAAGIAAPALTLLMGQVAIDQGRRRSVEEVKLSSEDAGEADATSSGDEEPEQPTKPPTMQRPPKSIANGTSRPAHPPREVSYVPGPPLSPSDAPDSAFKRERERQISPRIHKPLPQSQSLSHLPPSRRLAGPGSPLAGRMSTARRSPSGPSAMEPPRASPRTTMSPVLQNAASSSVATFFPPQSASVPVLPLASASRSSAALTSSSFDPIALSQSLPRPLLVKLLRSYACRAQLDLLTALQDISTRLILVPKPARLSALRAELTVLNHSLPRGCCICMNCGGEGRHHRIVRISPSEAVVLNSADRAPFLLQVEVLDGDLDFDPTRRQNAEDLRKVLDEREAAIARHSYRSAAHPPPRRKPLEPQTAGAKFATAVTDTLGSAMRRMGIEANEDDAGIRPPPGRRRSAHTRTASADTSFSSQHSASMSLPSSPPRLPISMTRASMPPDTDTDGDISTPTAANFSIPEVSSNEEVDLVEQLYGDATLHEMTSPHVETFSPQPIQNRSVDEEAWRRGERRSMAGALLSPDMQRSPLSASTSSNGMATGASTPVHKAEMTLDQYAERMRMAAVMLAQLSASQQPSVGLTGHATELVGAGVGLGAGLVGAALGRLPFGWPPTATASAGQASTGVATKLDTSTAAAAGVEVTSPRQRILSPTDAAAIRDRIMREMMDLENERMERMRLDSKARTGGWSTGSSGLSTSMSIGGRSGREEGDDASVVQRAVNKDDPSGAVLRESWLDKRARIRAASPYGHLATWDLLSVIVKTGADLRQEQLAVQLIREFGRVWDEASCPNWVRYFRILVTSDSTGLMETITDAVSVHSIKKEAYATSAPPIASGAGEPQQPFLTYTLYNHFVDTFGDPSTSTFRRAQDCFMKSLASYSVICYLLQIKDRHNGNILIDREGHVIHIDFGFLLSNSPGSLGFEMAPFKLPQDYMDILGGYASERFSDFRKLVKQCFWEARRQAERIIMIVELMQKDSNLPCFSSGEQTAQLLRERFQLSLTRTQCDDFVDRLIDSSALSVFTRLYDAFQQYSQGIL